VQLAAKYYYIKHGSESSLEIAQKVVRECMNMTIIENKSLVKLVQLVNSAHTEVHSYVIINIIVHNCLIWLQQNLLIS